MSTQENQETPLAPGEGFPTDVVATLREAAANGRMAEDFAVLVPEFLEVVADRLEAYRRLEEAARQVSDYMRTQEHHRPWDARDNRTYCSKCGTEWPCSFDNLATALEVQPPEEEGES